MVLRISFNNRKNCFDPNNINYNNNNCIFFYLYDFTINISIVVTWKVVLETWENQFYFVLANFIIFNSIAWYMNETFANIIFYNSLLWKAFFPVFSSSSNVQYNLTHMKKSLSIIKQLHRMNDLPVQISVSTAIYSQTAGFSEYILLT